MENTIFIPFVYLECKFLAGLVGTLLHFAVHTVTKNLGLDPAQHFHQNFYLRFFLLWLTYKSLRLGQCWISKASSWSLQLRRANWRPGNAGKISIHLAFVDKLMTQGPICTSRTETLMPVLTFSGSLIHEADIFSLSSCWKIFSYVVWQNQSILVTSPNQFSPLLIRPGYLHHPHSLHYSRTWFQCVSGNGMYCPQIQRTYLSDSHL